MMVLCGNSKCYKLYISPREEEEEEKEEIEKVSRKYGK